MVWLLVGVSLALAPAVDILRKFGRFSDEAFDEWMSSLTWGERIKLYVAVRTGIVVALYGWMTILLPRWR